MPARRLPTSFTATRPLTIAGTLYARGATVPAAAAAGLRRFSAYVSRGWLVPTPTQYPETDRRSTSWDKRRFFPPYDLSATELRKLLGL